MAKRATVTNDEDEPLELTPDMEADQGPDDESEEGDEGEEERDKPDDEGEAEAEGEEEGPEQYAFEEDDAAEGDNSVIRGLRERVKQLGRENQELRTAQPPVAPAPLPEKPTLAGCDYDEEVYEAALTDWHDQKQKADTAQAAFRREAEDANREWQRDLEVFNSRKAALGLPDFDDSANTVAAVLTLAQQAVIVKAASDSAAFTYALGRSDARLAELAKIQDPIKLAAAVARMEGGIKVVKRRKGAAPDRPVSGSGRMPGGTDKRLAELEKKADDSGDRTELIAYRKKLKARGK